MKSRAEPCLIPFLILLILNEVPHLATAEAAENKPVLLYSRYYNATGESRYLPHGTFKEILSRLRTEFEVRLHSEPLNAQTLAGVSLVLLANPSDKAVGTNPPPPC
jgi:hypothetical protein